MCVRLFAQFAFQTFLLAPDTDWSTFTMGRAYYSHLIRHLLIDLKNQYSLSFILREMSPSIDNFVLIFGRFQLLFLLFIIILNYSLFLEPLFSGLIIKQGSPSCSSLGEGTDLIPSISRAFLVGLPPPRICKTLNQRRYNG